MQLKVGELVGNEIAENDHIGLRVMGTHKLPLGGDPELKLDQLKRAAAQRGIGFQGTVDRGKFSGGGLNGHYRREGKFIFVTIIETPLFISEATVISQIKDFLN